MTAPTAARRGEAFPEFTLPALDGSSVFLESYRGQSNLVLVFAADMTGESPVTVLLEQLLARAEELTAEAAQVIVIVTSLPAGPQRGPWALPTLMDSGGDIHRTVGATDAAGKPAPAVFVTDRFREIFAAYLPGHGPALPDAKEILDWLVFINIQCPECGVPEWPT